MHRAKFQIYLDASQLYRWRLVDGNGRKVASSGESFSDRSAAVRAAQNVKVTAPYADIE
jgi:uncharacterized protein